MRAAWTAIVFLACVRGVAAAAADLPVDAVHVRAYDAVIEPHLDAGTITGRETVRVSLRRRAGAVVFDCGALVVESASDRDGPLRFVVDNHRLTVMLRTPRDAGATFTLTFAYHGAPTHGVRFFPDAEQVVTVFSTSEWLVCLDAPSERASVRLTIVVPARWAVVANGREVLRSPLTDGRVAHHFREDRLVPSYTFGFAAGRFDDTVDRQGGAALRYFTSGLPADAIHRVFDATRDMLTFFERTAGLPYPERTYTQVLTAGAGLDGQEMSGFSTLTGAYAQRALASPQDTTLAAHELAHQWWGNSVTCRDWTHFWLNEGFATFMAAAYIERRFGRVEYDRLIADYRATYERVRESGHDKPLVFADWRQPTADDRALVYRKGAYVLHLLRAELGDAAFWAGIRAYTRAFSERSVETGDFQHAMERSAKRSLASFFDRWVYLRGAPGGR